MDGDDMIHEKMRKPKQPKHPAILRFAAWVIMKIPGSKTSSSPEFGDGVISYNTRHINLRALAFPLDDDETYGYISVYLGNGSFIYWFDKPDDGEEGGKTDDGIQHQ